MAEEMGSRYYRKKKKLMNKFTQERGDNSHGFW